MGDLLRVKRGQAVNRPELMQGELGYDLDREDLYIGGVYGNVKVSSPIVSVKNLIPFTGVYSYNDAIFNSARIQTYLDAFEDTKILIPDGKYLVSQNIHMVNDGNELDGTGELIQYTIQTDTYSPTHELSNYPVILATGDRCSVSNITIKPKFEAINGSAVKGFKVERVKIDGQGLTDFNAIFINGSVVEGVKTVNGVKIYNCEIKNCGVKSTWSGTDADYGHGHGIGVYVATDVDIRNNRIFGNGANGIFPFACDTVDIVGNRCVGNGMSGIQVAFSSNEAYQFDYTIFNNKCYDNFADGIDINNATGGGIFSLDAILESNICKRNGFIDGHVTQDGSGICTLKYVKDIIIKNNISKESARTGLYAYNVDNVKIEGNNILKSSGTYEGINILNSNNIKIYNNDVKSAGASLRLDTAFVNLKIIGNTFESTASNSFIIPNGVTFDDYQISKNTFKGLGEINCLVSMDNNTITNTNGLNAILINANNVTLERNKISSSKSCINAQLKNNVNLIGNECSATTSATVNLAGCTNSRVSKNKFTALGSQPSMLVNSFTGTLANNINIENNEFVGGTGNNLRLQPTECGTITQSNNIYTGGTTEYGDGVVIHGNTLKGSVVYDAPSIAVGSQVTTTVPCIGATVGDIAVASISESLVDVMMTAFVSATNVVTVIIRNQGATSKDFAPDTLRVRVFKG